MIKRIFIFFILFSLHSYSQQYVDIKDFIHNSKKSIDYSNFEKNKLIDEKENLLFRKSFFPEVSLKFTLPTYNRSISNVIQPDGSIAFRESNNANSRVNLSVSQKIPYTGGKLTISNSFNRLDLFGDNQNSTSYSASWFGINFSQSLNFFNAMKWDKKIYEAKLQYKDLSYLRSNTELKKKAIDLYFSLLQIKKEKEIIEKKQEVAIKYNDIVKSLIKHGRAMSYDSIDSKLKLLDILKDIDFIKKSENLKTESINNFFTSDILKNEDSLGIPKLNFEYKDLKFYINRYLYVFSIIEKNTLLGLEKNIKQLEKNRFYSADLSLGVGFNNSSEIYNDVFQNPNQSQNFSISLNIPLLDFGKKGFSLKFLKLNMKLKYQI